MNGRKLASRVVGATVAAATLGYGTAFASWGDQHAVGVGSFQDMIVRADGTTVLAFSISEVPPLGLSVALVDAAGDVRREEVAAGRFAQGALAESGRELLVAWGAADGVKVRSRVGGAWTSTVTIGGGDRLNVRVAASPSGRAVVIWQGPGRRLTASWRNGAAGAWHAPVLLGSGPPIASMPASVGMDRAGNAIVVWRTGAARGRVFARMLSAGATAWSQAVRLSPPGVFTDEARLAVGAGGDVLVGWRTHRTLWLSSGRLPRIPGPARRMATGLLGSPAVGVGPRADAAVLWIGAGGRTYVRSRSVRGAFSATQRTPRIMDSTAVRGWGRYAEIPIDASGTATFIRVSVGGCPVGAYPDGLCVTAYRRTLAGRWTRPRGVLSTPVGGENALPFVAAGSSGAVSIAGSWATDLSDVGAPPDSFVQLVSWRP